MCWVWESLAVWSLPGKSALLKDKIIRSFALCFALLFRIMDPLKRKSPCSVSVETMEIFHTDCVTLSY